MKVSEKCSRCATPVDPNDKLVTVETQGRVIPLRLWRYDCSCGWTWANAAQRAHNQQIFDRGWRANTQLWGG